MDKVVLASSAKQQEVEHYLDLLDARDLADGWTTSADVEATKPEPDLIHAAMEKAEAESGLMIGDSVIDLRTAKRAGTRACVAMYGYGFHGALEDKLRPDDMTIARPLDLMAVL